MRVGRVFKPLYGAVLDFLYPPYCLLCGRKFHQEDIPICPACWEKLPAEQDPICRRCGAALVPGVPGCRACQGRTFEFDRARVLSRFNPQMQQLVHHVKYKHKKEIARRLGQRLGHQVGQDPDFRRAQCLVPVPLHAARKRWRGFNQSEYIARGLSQVLRVPVADRLLARKRKTRSQTRFNAQARKENVKDAFAVTVRDQQSLPRRVILVDDVLTTGATLNECARMLRRAGVANISVLTLARA